MPLCNVETSGNKDIGVLCDLCSGRFETRQDQKIGIFQESLIHALIFHHLVHVMMHCALLQFMVKLFVPKNVN